AAPGAVAHPARVDRSRVAVERDAYGVVELLRQPVRSPEVHPGAERDRRELDVSSRDAVDDLVEGAVAADRDHERRTVVDRACRELDQVAGPLREARLALEPGARGTRRELGPAAARAPGVGGRVDEEDDAGHPRPARRSQSPTATSSAMRVMRSSAARRSSSLIRVNSPSTTMSETVSRQPLSTPRSAPIVNSAAASISTARTPRFDQRSYWPSSGL